MSMGGKIKIIIKCRNETNNKLNCENINWTVIKFVGSCKNNESSGVVVSKRLYMIFYSWRGIFISCE